MSRIAAEDPPQLFVDTWGWIVLADDRASGHAEVLGLRRRFAERRLVWVTSDYVLDETFTRLYARGPFHEVERFCAGIFDQQKLGLLTVERISPERFQKAYAWRLRYRDKPRISFTDLTSFVVMRELGIRHVLTGDLHFKQVHLGFHILP